MSLSTDPILNPFPWYTAMRETNPITFNPEYRTWSVFRYNDVQRVLSEYATFSSHSMGNQGPLNASLINMDPPRHRQMRSLVSLAFTPRRIAQLEERITVIVNELLDNVMAHGKMDVIDDLAYPLPVIVIAEMLGIPIEDRADFKRWSDQLVGLAPSGGNNPQVAMSNYFRKIIELRRHTPANDLISALLEAQIDGKHLDEIELLGFCILLLIAGNETTTNLLGNAILCFDEHPEVVEQLRAEPALLPDAIEEILRYRSPIKLMFRIAIKDTTIGDQEIQAGQALTAWISSANRDEAQFPHAEEFDIRRTPNRHLAFGYGIHFCLGAPLARLEARIALAAMLERLPEIRRDQNIPLEPIDSFIFYSVKHLPITFKRT